MGYKQREKQVYQEMLPLLEEFKQLELWWERERVIWQKELTMKKQNKERQHA